MAELAELAEVAADLWQYKDEIIGGGRMLWDFMKSPSGASGSKTTKKFFNSGAVPVGNGKKAVAARQAARSMFAGHSVATQAGSRSVDATPLARSITEHSPTMYHEKSITHEKWGDGIRCTGRMVISDLILTESPPEPGIGLFLAATDGGYTCCTEQVIYLTPSWMGLRLAANTPFYEMFAFRHVRLMYSPIVAATAGGALALAYVDDPAEAFAAATPGEIITTEVLAVTPSVMSPFREASSLEFNYGGDALFYSEVKATTAPDLRMNVQGAFIGAGILVDPSQVGQTMGTFVLEYVCDFHHQTVSLVNDLDKGNWLPAPSERAAVASFLRSFRVNHPGVTPASLAAASRGVSSSIALAASDASPASANESPNEAGTAPASPQISSMQQVPPSGPGPVSPPSSSKATMGVPARAGASFRLGMRKQGQVRT